jgi:hypothetical protein
MFTICKQSPPVASGVITPVNNASIIEPTTLKWNVSSWGTNCPLSTVTGTYNLFLSRKNPPYQDPAIARGLTKGEYLVDVQSQLGMYYWAFTATSNLGLEMTSPVYNFLSCKETSPESPPLIQPANGTVFQVLGGQPSIAVTFTWDPVSFGDLCVPLQPSYSVIATPNSPGTVLVANTTSTTASIVFEDADWYTFVVRAANGKLSNFSDSRMIRICKDTLPGTPTAASPGTTIIGPDVALSWTTAGTGMTSCSIDAVALMYLSTTNPPTEVRAVEPFTTVTHTVTGLASGTYYFSVQVVNNNAYSPMSNVVSFVVCNNVAPSALIHSQPGATVPGTNVVTFQWSDPSYGTSCSSQANTVEVFWGLSRVSMASVASATAPTTTTTYTAAAPGQYYYFFRVTNGALSTDTGVFKVAVNTACSAETAETPVLVTPANNAIIKDTEVTLEWSTTFVGETCGGTHSVFTVFVDGVAMLSGIETTIATVTVTAGSHEWSIRASESATSGTRTFCVSPPPSIPALATPADESKVVWPYTFDWSVSSWTASCGYPLKTVVLVDWLEHAVGTDSMVTVPGLNKIGDHNWQVVASHASESRSATNSFSVCQPQRPQSPTPVLPAINDIVIPPVEFEFTAGAPGDGCNQGSPFFVLMIVGSSPVNVTSSGSPAVVSSGLVPGEYVYTIRANNGLLWSSSSPSIPFVYCEPLQPPPIPLLRPANRTVGAISTDGGPVSVTLSWNQSLENLGIACLKSPTQDMSLSLREADALTPATVTNLSFSADTSFTVSSLAPGKWYEWWLTLATGRHTVESQHRLFRVCTPVSPSNTTLISPASGVLIPQRLVELSWDLGSFGDACSDTAKKTFEVWVGLEGSPLTLFAVVENSTLRTTTISLLTGNWSWQIVAQWGGFRTASSIWNFEVCVPEPPGQPTPISPIPGAAVLVTEPNITFVAHTTTATGRTCIRNVTDGYQLLIGPTGAMTAVAFVPWTANDTVTFTYSALAALGTGEFAWSVASVNTDGQNTEAPVRMLTVCENPSVVGLVAPANNSEGVPTTSAKVTWETATAANWGYSCSSSRTTQFRVYWAAFPKGTAWTEENVTEWVAAGPSSNDTTLEERLPQNSTIVWRVGVHNGGGEALSPFFVFTTVERDCRSVNCTNGACEDSTLICTCNAGWRGIACNMEIKSKAGVIAGSVVAGLFIIAAIAVALILALLAWRKRRRQQLLTVVKPTDELRFLTCIAPSTYSRDPLVFERDVLIPDLSNFTVALAMAERVSPTESDLLATALIYAYERHNRSLNLLKALITKEVRTSDSAQTLFRMNSLATKCFKVYSKLVGLPYLYDTFAVLLEELLRMEDDVQAEEEEAKKGNAMSVRLYSEGQYEVDPTTGIGEEELTLNATRLMLTAQKFILQIFRSADRLPPQIREVCHHVQQETIQKYSDEKVGRVAVGAFIFLRFLNVAISVPESYGLLHEPPSESLRRVLVLTTKLLQLLSTETLPGAKETFMCQFTDLLRNNWVPLGNFYMAATRFAEGTSTDVVPIPETLYQNALKILDMTHKNEEI